MTTMARTDPVLKRLFDGLDFAVRPRSRDLAEIAGQWKAGRGGRILPLEQDVAPPDRWSAPMLLARFDKDANDYVLLEGSPALDEFLGPLAEGQSICRAPRRRMAARLHRLFDAVRNMGEPILAEFADRRDHALVEVLAAPLSTDGHTVGSVLCGFARVP